MKVYKGKDQWKRKSKSDVKATTVDLCRADRDRMDKVRVMEEGSNGTTCEVRCIKELQVMGNGLAHLLAFHLSHSQFQISTSLIID